ncbi:MAG: phospho-N-acetylmuramoyl-pentapeptide-transferase [Bacillota bacterium]|nr:phospho-N-acetylmuramoyl-pentapeptide-transferase [Bacillota bacterium]
MTNIILAGIVSLITVLVIGPKLIGNLHKLKYGQTVRTDGPKTHLKKSGVPTMGGVLFLTGTALSTLLFARSSDEALIILAIVLGYGLIGFIDDFIIVKRKQNLGLKARHKLFFQIALGLLIGVWAANAPHIGTLVYLPFGGALELPIWLFVPFAALVLVATTNAVNLTDGLDGLAAGTVVITLLPFALVLYVSGRLGLLTFTVSLIGSLLGFLYFNRHPARIFMGDTGSIALGAALGGISILTGTELFLVIVGGLFVIEVLSDIIQVVVFKRTGRRVFRMAPIHHHFELLGWSETKVVWSFYLVALVFALIGTVLLIRLW